MAYREVLGKVAPSLQALFRHIVIGGLWRPVKRRAENELIAELTQSRYSSFPFISPDTFRALCDIVIEGGQTYYRAKMTARHVVFFDLADIDGSEVSFKDSPSLRELYKVLGTCDTPPVVIMSHGDLVPADKLIGEIASRSTTVFSINLKKESETIRGIPLGLENFSRNQNGRLTDYLNVFENGAMWTKTRDVFTAFEAENNRRVREPLIEVLKSSRFGWNPRRVGPKEYRRAVQESLFVLSPPGRGLDCHRTWEAIYLGAVPVVLEGSLAPSLIAGVPILEVSSYADFLWLNHEEMLNLYENARLGSPERCYMPYWVGCVLSSASE